MAGLYFEDFSQGQAFTHEWTRTVTEMDNVLFCSLTMNVQPLHLDAEFAAKFAAAAGIDVEPVPYKGQPAAIVDLMGGRIDFVASDLGAVLPHIAAKRIRAVAVVADTRSSNLPDVPTVEEAGLPAVDVRTWIGVAGPAGLPQDVVNWWETQIKESVETPRVIERLRAMGKEPAPLMGTAFQEFVAAQHDAWGRQSQAAGITPE